MSFSLLVCGWEGKSFHMELTETTRGVRFQRFLKANNELTISVDNRRLSRKVPLTKDKCIISYEDEQTDWRVKMPCGHALCPNTLVEYCRTELEKGFYSIECPVDTCHTEWSYTTVREYAALTLDERAEFEKLLTENYMMRVMGTQKCPFCESICMRNDPSYVRIICPNCKAKKRSKGHEFCWLCLGGWKSSGYRPCGNSGCTGEDSRFEILRNSEMKKFDGVPEPGYARRACPACGLVIEHLVHCKHMTCFCGCQFCFICMQIKPKDTTEWPCGQAYHPCKLAPVQTKIPGANSQPAI